MLNGGGGTLVVGLIKLVQDVLLPQYHYGSNPKHLKDVQP